MAHLVLVHGAFGGAWNWEAVIPELAALGHTAEAFDLPGAGDDTTPVEGVTLETCAARVGEALEHHAEPVVLVAHSMGGVVVTQAASSRRGLIDSLVFVCGFMPRDGQSLLELTTLPEGAGDMIQANLVVSGEPPAGTLSEEALTEAIYNRCSPEQVAAAMARRRPQPVAPLATPVQVDDTVLASIPRSYVVTTADNALPPALQRRMVGEHPCRDVVEIDTDHAPYLSATAELVTALDRFVRAS
jgi:pimeloyl-ACP methyl ester carboxylesterase